MDTPFALAPRDRSGQYLAPEKLERIVGAAVRLAALGPKLADLAGQAQTQADVQAENASGASAAAGHLADELSTSVAQLRSASVAVGEASEEIARLADQTRVLSINAHIEASRAGSYGKAFMVVAQHVERLAVQTRLVTTKIEERVRAIEAQVARVSSAVVSEMNGGAVTVTAVHRRVEQMATIAGDQRAGSHHLHGMGDEANHLAEDLLLEVGSLRLGVHALAATRVRELLPILAALPWRAQEIDPVLGDWLTHHPSFELLYLTDGQGHQVSSNIGRSAGAITRDAGAQGRHWGERPWFTGALEQGGQPFVSDIYRSTATGQFCFTISAAVRSPAGGLMGVLGADINFQTMAQAQAGN